MGIRLDILAVTAASLAIGAGVGVWQDGMDKVYGASSLMVVNPAPATLASSGARPENAVFLARNYAARLEARPVLATAVEQSGLHLTVDEADDRTSVSVSSTDATIAIRTTGPTAAAAQALNLALTRTVTAQVESEQQAVRDARLAPLDSEIASVETDLQSLAKGSPQRLAAEEQYRALVTTRADTQVEPLDRMEVLSPATSFSDPVAPHPLRSALLAFLIAAAVLAQIAVWRQHRRGAPQRALRTPYPETATVPIAPTTSTLSEDTSAIRRMAQPGRRRLEPNGALLDESRDARPSEGT